MPYIPRRQFLVLTSSALASLAASLHASVFAAPRGTVRAWRTSGETRFGAISLGQWQPRTGISVDRVEIDPGRSFQSVLGFGAAFTDASCYLLSRMDDGARTNLLAELLGPEGIRLSVGRTCMGASDYSRDAYSYDDGADPDPSLSRFSIEHDREYILPILRAAKQANPEMYYFSAPWSPPGWMKSGGSMLGGSMRKKYFSAYADYFVKFLEAYREEGIDIRAVTTQNEVDTDQDARMPATLWGQEYEEGFIREFLGPALQRSFPEAKIWLLDHNYNLWGRVVDELGDPDVFRYVDGVAWHGYVGQPEAMTRVHDAFPTKHAYWTEGGPDISSPDYAKDWASWSANFAGILRNWARCIVSWNVILDEKGLPNIGPFSCGGLVTLDSSTKKVIRSGQYWAFAHYSKRIQRGATVIRSSGEHVALSHIAVRNPDGSYVLVLTNQGAERQVICGFIEQQLAVELPANSVTTIEW